MATSTVEQQIDPVASAVRNLRVCRTHMLRLTGVLDRLGEREACHSLRLSLTSLDDCLAELSPPALTPLQMDRLMDLQADADRSVER